MEGCASAHHQKMSTRCVKRTPLFGSLATMQRCCAQGVQRVHRQQVGSKVDQLGVLFVLMLLAPDVMDENP